MFGVESKRMKCYKMEKPWQEACGSTPLMNLANGKWCDNIEVWKDKHGDYGCLIWEDNPYTVVLSWKKKKLWNHWALNPTQFIMPLPLPTLHTCPPPRSSKRDHLVLVFLSRPGEWNPAPRQLSPILLVTPISLFHIHPIISNAGYFRKSTGPLSRMLT